MNQVFVNLIANGAQAVEGRGNLWISSEVDTATDQLLIRIRDDGKGIPPEQIDKIFDPFFTTKKVGEGTGLGLSIVYGILKRHGATIDVKSLLAPAEGHGTEFTLRIPRTVSAKAPDFDGTSKAS
jgi:signal transduction histidine kinase